MYISKIELSTEATQENQETIKQILKEVNVANLSEEQKKNYIQIVFMSATSLLFNPKNDSFDQDPDNNKESKLGMIYTHGDRGGEIDSKEEAMTNQIRNLVWQRLKVDLDQMCYP